MEAESSAWTFKDVNDGTSRMDLARWRSCSKDLFSSTDQGTVRWCPPWSLSELKSIQFNVKPNNSIWVRGISFQPARYFSGNLELRSLVVHAHTQHSIYLLTSSLREVKGVAELRSNKVLVNLVPSDDRVCQLFRESASNLAPNPTLCDHVNEKRTTFRA
jgi:hypothetical protein